MKLNTLNEKESVLVIVLSETREHEHTFELFKNNLLDIMDADLCLCVANNHREDKNNPFYQHAKFIWSYDEPDDWGDAFDVIQKKWGLHNNWRKLLEIKNQWLGGVKGCDEHPGSAGILLFFRIFLKASILKHRVIDKYDRFIITRSDFMHRIPHVPLRLLGPEYIWIPNGEDYGGYTDRHIIAHRNDVLNVLSIGDRIITEPLKLHSEMAFSTKWNLERFIKFSFAHLGLVHKIRRYPYTMYTVRSPGGHTRWKKGYFNERLGYYIKYKSEYASYKLASVFVNKHADWNKIKVRLFAAIRSLQIRYYSNVQKYKLFLIKRLALRKRGVKPDQPRIV